MNIFNRQISLLPILFMLHNIEEVIAIHFMNDIHFLSAIHHISQFIIAVLLFTILGFIVVFWKSIYKTNTQYQYIVLGFTGMLFLNSFFPHILSAIYFRRYTPGLITAFFLILPFTGFILWKFHHLKIFPTGKELITIFTGGIIGILLVFIFLGIGYMCT